MRRQLGSRELLALLCRSFVFGVDCSAPLRSMSPSAAAAAVASAASARERSMEQAVHVPEKTFSVSREDLMEAHAGLDMLMHFRYS